MRRTFFGLLLTFGSLALAAEPTAPAPTEQEILVECHGKLRCGMVAIGGNTTGTTITFGGVVWELSLPDEANKKFAQGHDKEHVTVKGKLRRVTGGARPLRWVVDVTQIRDPEAGEKRNTATTTICGKLQKQDGGVVVSCNDITWPVDLSKSADLQSKADSLTSKTVVIQGSIEKIENRNLPAKVKIEAKAIEPAPAATASKK